MYWNASGEISGSALHSMSVPDGTNGYQEITCYLRAPGPGYDQNDRARIDILNNNFYDTGRLGVVAHDFVDVHIERNVFDKIISDFGYGVEIGSTASGTVRHNTFHNFDTYASDQSVAAAVLIENSFTQGQGPYEKNVTVDSNNISFCQYGLYVGNSTPNLTGDVDIIAGIYDNSIYDNETAGSYASGGIVLMDEGRDAGSAVRAVITGNSIDNCNEYGVLIATSGNGDIAATLMNNLIKDNFTGVSVKNYGGVSTSVYNLTIFHNMFDNFLNAEDDAFGDFWDDGEEQGNCWEDFDGQPGDSYIIQGSAGAVDRFPNVDCGSNCNCVPGDANNDGAFNLLDILYIISFVYDTPSGPDPVPYTTCSGDPTCDCAVNLLDILKLIDKVYYDPTHQVHLCGCPVWFATCGLPLRAVPVGAQQEDLKSHQGENIKAMSFR